MILFVAPLGLNFLKHVPGVGAIEVLQLLSLLHNYVFKNDTNFIKYVV